MQDRKEKIKQHASFKVKGLDCAEEVAILKKELGTKDGILDLDFDVVNAKMTVTFDSQIISEQLLATAAALEANSEHHLAKAILRKAESQNIVVNAAEDFQAIKGKGAEGSINGRLCWIGSHRLMHDRGEDTKEVHKKILEFEDAGHTVVAVGNDEHVCGIISIADSVRPVAREAVTAIKKAGIEKVVMITGDNSGTAAAIAGQIGVDDYRAELLPEEKVAAVESLVKDYSKVAMVGDGINDAPALATATCPIMNRIMS